LNAAVLRSQGHVVHQLDLERDRLPFETEGVDLILANQVLEHTKEIFWIFHEVARSLRIGGHFIFGVPNVCSFHNRVLMLAGRHPTQHKLYSAHVRPFSKADTLRFLEVCAPGTFELCAFAGSQFYPAPAGISRLLARAFPTAAFSIFFMIRKVRDYDGGFLTHPVDAALETNFWLGPTAAH
jgi:SAM-dependent methyltransferase